MISPLLSGRVIKRYVTQTSLEVMWLEEENNDKQGNRICDRAWEKGPCRAFKKNRVITTVGKSRL